MLCFSSKEHFTNALFPQSCPMELDSNAEEPKSLGGLPASKAQPQALTTADDLSLDIRAGLASETFWKLRRHLCPHWSVGMRVAASHVKTPSGDITWKPNQGTDNTHTHTNIYIHTMKTVGNKKNLPQLEFPPDCLSTKTQISDCVCFPQVLKLFLSLFSRWETSHMHTNMLKSKICITGPLSFVFSSTVLDTCRG